MFQLSLSLPRSIHVLAIGLHWYCYPVLKEIVPNPSGGENVRGKLNVFKHAANGITDFCPCQPCIPFNSNDPLYRQLLDLLHYEFIDIMNGPISSELPPTFPISNVFCLQLTNDIWCVISLAQFQTFPAEMDPLIAHSHKVFRLSYVFYFG